MLGYRAETLCWRRTRNVNWFPPILIEPDQSGFRNVAYDRQFSVSGLEVSVPAARHQSRALRPQLASISDIR